MWVYYINWTTSQFPLHNHQRRKVCATYIFDIFDQKQKKNWASYKRKLLIKLKLWVMSFMP